MFHDFRSLTAGKTIEVDLCIVGAGAAGISIAKRLASSGLKIFLLDSGGFQPDQEIQSLYEGQNVGFRYFDLSQSRLRYFGGSTNHWDGYCAPLNEVDFEPRSWILYSGWPIRKKDLIPYYPDAHTLCELGPYGYVQETWSDLSRSFPDFHAEKLRTRFWYLSRPVTRFGQVWRSDLEMAKDVDVYLYANVTEFETDKTASTVRGARLRTIEGNEGFVRANYFVLACGGIENPRLLLLSNKVEKSGLGNRYDLVGRFFMEHLYTQCGRILAKEPESMSVFSQRLQSEKLKKDGVFLRPAICPTAEAQKQREMINCGFSTYYKEDITGYSALWQMMQDVSEGDLPDNLGEKLWTVMTDLDSVAEGLYSRMQGQPYKAPESPYLFALVEQTPNPDSRITLGNEVDRLGLKKINLDWQLTKKDKAMLRAAAQLVGEELGRPGIGAPASCRLANCGR